MTIFQIQNVYINGSSGVARLFGSGGARNKKGQHSRGGGGQTPPPPDAREFLNFYSKISRKK